MLNICAKVYENRACSIQEITLNAKNQRRNQRTKERTNKHAWSFSSCNGSKLIQAGVEEPYNKLTKLYQLSRSTAVIVSRSRSSKGEDKIKDGGL